MRAALGALIGAGRLEVERPFATDCFKLPRLAAHAQVIELSSPRPGADAMTWGQGSPREPAAPGNGNIQAPTGRRSALEKLQPARHSLGKIAPDNSAEDRRKFICGKHLHAHHGAC